MLKALGLLMVIVLSAGCTGLPSIPLDAAVGSGNLVSQEFELSDFDQVDASHSFQVSLTQGDEFAVTVSADDNVVDKLNVVVSDGTLKLGLLEPGFYSNLTLIADVTMPDLSRVSLSGASRLDMPAIVTEEDFRGSLSGASLLTGDLSAVDVELDLSGASRVTLDGSAESLDLEASGASRVDLAEFEVDAANVQVSGASTAVVNVTGTLDVEASGASRVEYVGSPRMGRMATSGSSSVIPR
jgi:hypothetical protein